MESKNGKKITTKSFFRRQSKYILNKIKKNGIKKNSLGLYYFICHCLIIFLVGFNLIFNVNVNHLALLLIIVSLDALSVVVLHGCPLTTLEENYLDINTCHERTKQLKHMGIFYRCRHEYEKQLELLINVWTLITGKILFISYDICNI